MTNSIDTRPTFIRWLWISGLTLFGMMFHSLIYAGENTLLNDQILHISKRRVRPTHRLSGANGQST